MSHYIGKTISLVSNKGLRYVGLLDNINADDATVALKSVRLFGSEGRLAAQGTPHLEVLPGNDIYDYVVFRGSDVKDLSVLDIPIDQVKPAPVQNYFPPQQNQAPAPQQQAPAGPQPTQTSSQPLQPSSQTPHAITAVGGAASGATPQPTSAAKAPGPTSVSGANSVPGASYQGETTNQVSATASVQEKATKTDSLPQSQPQSQPQPSFSSSNPPAQPQPGSRPSQQVRGVDIPQEAFDFESANAKFTKELESEKELEHSTYNKQSSFFDNISSSNEQRSTMRWSEEKSLNMDTFGEVGSESRGRGRGRGRGGRGQWRGGRGRGNGEWRGGRGNGRGRGRGGYRSDPNSDYNTKPEWA